MFVITTSCPNFSFKKFPFDTLQCSIVIKSFENIDKLEYFVDNFIVDNSIFQNSGNTDIWTLVPGSVQSSITNVTHFNYGKVTNIELEIQFQRKYQYYISEIFVPQNALFLLQLSALILPSKMVERPVFSMTVLLAYFFILDTIFNHIPDTTETVYAAIMTVVKLFMSILLTIYMLITCNIANTKHTSKLEKKLRKIDIITIVLMVILAISTDSILFNRMIS